MMLIIFFVLGLVFGSFLSVLVSRLDKRGGIFLGRSECQKCKTQLGWVDLIPIISFVMLKRQCRYCKYKLSYLYPTIELITGSAFALFFLKNGIPNSIETWYQFILMFFLISVIFFDYLYYTIPDKIVLPLIILSLVISIVLRQAELINLLTSGLLFGGFFAMLYVVSHGEWIGLGDAKLTLLIGLSLGYPLTFIVVAVSIWTAAIVGLLLIAFKKASMKSALPLGLFLSTCSIVIIIFQNEAQIFKSFLY